MSDWRKWLSCFLFTVSVASCATDDPLGEGDPGRQDPNACANPCEAGETRCNGSSIEACSADNRGCFGWTVGVDCAADGTQCDDSAEPAICLTDPGTCQDGEANQDESDVDCGGSRCVPCAVGAICLAATDCSTNNCDLGVSNECVPADQETCTDGAKNGAETDVDCGGGVCPSCGAAADCAVDSDCASGECDAGSCTEPANNMGCNPGEARCAGNTVQSCDQNQWVETQICAQACNAGSCDDAVQCTAGEDRCFKNSVQTCNVTGSAWQHLDICEDDCMDGLCVGACDPTALRCNGGVQEMCGMDGQTWAQNENCALGCDHRVCIEDKLENKGVPMTLGGPHVYQGCVTVELGGSIEVPDGEVLEIWAKCLKVTDSSSIDLGAGSQFVFHAEETITNAGSITGGDRVRLDAYGALTNTGEVSSAVVELRGDVLTNASTATVNGSSAALLYGSAITNEGTFSGTESVMPPEALTSPTHPEGFQWNMSEDDVSIAWDKPFASAKGYYWNVNDGEVPTPSNGEFSSVENVTIPLDVFRAGVNRVQVVSVNADSTVGTVPVEFVIDFNVTAPVLSSSSHPDSTQWSSTDDVFIEWADAPSVDANSVTGYWYAWDHRGDTQPDETNGTFRNDEKILMNDQADGLWMFHIVSIDRLGRTSPEPSRYEVRVGASPGLGNVAGTVTDANGDPVRGATVLLNGGVYLAHTVASGDYTFRGQIPAAAFDWEIEVRAPGYTSMNDTLRMAPDMQKVLDFRLRPDNQPPDYRLGPEIELATGLSTRYTPPHVVAGRRGEVGWTTNGRAGVSTNFGVPLLTQNFNQGTSARNTVGFDGSRYFLAYSASCSYYECPAMRFWDQNHEPLGAPSFYDWRYTYAWSSFFDGTEHALLGLDSSRAYVAVVDPEADDVLVPEGELLDTGVSRDARLRTIFDGSSLAYAVPAHGQTSYTVHFGRLSKDGSVVQSDVEVGEDVDRSSWPGVAFDGTDYHVSFVDDDDDAYLARIDPAGSVSAPVKLAGLGTSSYHGVGLAFDGANLLVVYGENGDAVLEVRSPVDYTIVASFALGASIDNPQVTYDPRTGVAIVSYVGDSNALRMRMLRSW